jgi:hypothetical protein
MDLLQKPQRALKKFVSKVSIQTVIKNGDAEDTEPLSSSRARQEWPLTTAVDLRNPKVCLFNSNFNLTVYLSDIENPLTGPELAILEERYRIHFTAHLDSCGWNSKDAVCHHEQCYRSPVQCIVYSGCSPDWCAFHTSCACSPWKCGPEPGYWEKNDSHCGNSRHVGRCSVEYANDRVICAVYVCENLTRCGMGCF